MARRFFGQMTVPRQGDRFAPAAILAWLTLFLAPNLAPDCDARAASAGEDCVIDRCADKAPAGDPDPGDAGPAPQSRSGAPGARSAAGDFDFYVLALSWSPGFCKTPAATHAHGQCDPGAGLGFVVHGLWPQYERGYPENCQFGARSPSRMALAGAAGLYPSDALARYEWRKHGVCSGKSPTDYFGDVRRARQAIVPPPPFQNAKAEQNWTSIDIERAFIAANPRLRPGMIGVACRQGVLQEVRVCFSKDLRDFHSCPEVSRRGCPIGPVSVPPAL